MNTKLRAEAKNDFEKDFFKLMNNAVFRKTMEYVRKHRDTKLVTTDYQFSEPNQHTAKYFPKNLMAIEMKKTRLKINKLIYLGMSILDISKTLMYEFWYDNIKAKYQDRTKLYYTDTDSFIIHIKTDDFYKDIANDVEKWFDTLNYSEDECNSIDKRPLPIGKNNNVIDLFKDELGEKIMKEFVVHRGKTYAYLIDGNSEHKKRKSICILNGW